MFVCSCCSFPITYTTASSWVWNKAQKKWEPWTSAVWSILWKQSPVEASGTAAGQGFRGDITGDSYLRDSNQPSTPSFPAMCSSISSHWEVPNPKAPGAWTQHQRTKVQPWKHKPPPAPHGSLTRGTSKEMLLHHSFSQSLCVLFLNSTYCLRIPI